MRGNEGTTMRWVMTALSAATLAACGGSGPSNELPKGIKEISATAYPATTVGKGDTAATQDLLTGGIGKTGLGAAATPAYADPANPRRPSCGAMLCIPTTAAFSTRRPGAVMACCTAPMSRPTAR